jgi:hypothetical protein
MGFKWGFRKSKKIAKGLRLSVGRKHASVRIGGKRAGLTLGTKGAKVGVRLPFGIRVGS